MKNCEGLKEFNPFFMPKNEGKYRAVMDKKKPAENFYG
jgi:hypothetical protein